MAFIVACSFVICLTVGSLGKQSVFDAAFFLQEPIVVIKKRKEIKTERCLIKFISNDNLKITKVALMNIFSIYYS